MAESGISLKEYFERIMDEKDKALAAALASAKEAVQVVETNGEKWRANANEWRAAMSDRDNAYMTKAEFVIYKQVTEKIIEELKLYVNSAKGVKQGISEGWGWLIGAIGIVLAIAGFLQKIGVLSHVRFNRISEAYE